MLEPDAWSATIDGLQGRHAAPPQSWPSDLRHICRTSETPLRPIPGLVESEPARPTGPRPAILDVIGDGITAPALAAIRGVSRQAAQQQLQKLAAAGFVESIGGIYVPA